MRVSINLPSFPALPDTSSLPLPSVADVSEAVSDVLVTALDTAGDAATVVVATARRQPKVAIGVGVAAAVLLVLMYLCRRRHRVPQAESGTDARMRVAAA
jgi:Na+-transporting NADH:ubiquinone oxidoreductase subunit NqrA